MAPLRILHLEDNRMDAELVEAALAADGVPCTLVRVGTRGEFLEALERSPFDLVLSDYSIPGFNGVAAYSIVRAKRPDVPFVFVSGTMGEEVAVECLKDGATDYVLKHRLGRLGPAVRRAIEQ